MASPKIFRKGLKIYLSLAARKSLVSRKYNDGNFKSKTVHGTEHLDAAKSLGPTARFAWPDVK